ncbi:MAG: ABC transporter substrate-binding protein [Acidobacteriota bacterium]
MKNTIFIVLFLTLFSSVFAQTDETIKVGIFADMTGQTASFGVSTLSGIKMAADEINAKGGINGRKIELILEDNQGLPENTKTVVQKLIKEKKVHALLGEVLSTNSLAAAPIAQAAKIPMISPSSTNPRVTKVGDYIFRTCFIDDFQGEAMAKFAFETLKMRRIALLTDFNSDYAKGLSESFATTFTRLGGRIISQKTYFQGDEDYSQQLLAIKKTNPQAIYLTGYYNSVGVIAKQARAMKITAPILGGDGWDSPSLFELSGNSLNNSYITDHFSLESPNEKVKKFSTDYKNLYGLDADGFAALAYDAMYVLADSVQRAKSTESQKLREAIATTKNFDGVTGKITINNSRNADKPVVILKLQNPNFIYHSTIQ